MHGGFYFYRHFCLYFFSHIYTLHTPQSSRVCVCLIIYLLALFRILLFGSLSTNSFQFTQFISLKHYTSTLHIYVQHRHLYSSKPVKKTCKCGQCSRCDVLYSHNLSSSTSHLMSVAVLHCEDTWSIWSSYLYIFIWVIIFLQISWTLPQYV